jgi:uncharacterized membrane protein YdjX (TVP38/TMEM64 family)
VNVAADAEEEQRIKTDASGSISLCGRFAGFVCARVRLLLVIAVIVVLHVLGWTEVMGNTVSAWMVAYAHWANTFRFAVPVYAMGMIAITAVVPLGGYSGATVLTGATFDHFWLAWPISYVQVNCAAMLNLAIVRLGCRALDVSGMAKAQSRFGWLDTKLSEPGWTPMKIVVLSRLPYMASSPLSWAFAMSNIGVRPYLLGNLVGFLPGSVVFSALGENTVSLWAALSSDGLQFSWELVQAASFLFLMMFAVITMVVIGRRWFLQQQAEAAEASRQPFRILRQPSIIE